MNLPFFEPSGSCPKCGHDQVSVVYSAGRSTGAESCSYYCPMRGKQQEHLERSCDRCHYRWPEAVLGQAEPPAASDAPGPDGGE